MNHNSDKKIFLFLGIFMLAGSGCMSLDPFLFYGEPLTTYQFDSYTGKRECGDALDTISALENAGKVTNRFVASDARQCTLNSGGERIAAVFVSSRARLTPADTIIVYFHGNAQHLDYNWPRVRLLYAAGYPVFAIDYRGFGSSTGTTTEQGLFADARAAMDFVRDSLGNPRTVVYGYSLGSIPSSEVASVNPDGMLCKFILEAPIHSIATLTDDGSYLDLPRCYLTTFASDNAEKIKKVTAPFFWLHGTHDERVGRETNGLPIWNNYSGSQGYYVKVEGGSHADLPTVIGYARYIDYISCFILGKKNPSFISK